MSHFQLSKSLIKIVNTGHYSDFKAEGKQDLTFHKEDIFHSVDSSDNLSVVFKSGSFNFLIFACHKESSESKQLIAVLRDPLTLTIFVDNEHSQIQCLLFEPENRLDLYHPSDQLLPHVSAKVHGPCHVVVLDIAVYFLAFRTLSDLFMIGLHLWHSPQKFRDFLLRRKLFLMRRVGQRLLWQVGDVFPEYSGFSMGASISGLVIGAHIQIQLQEKITTYYQTSKVIFKKKQRRFLLICKGIVFLNAKILTTSQTKFDLNIANMHPFKKIPLSSQQARTPCKSIHNQLNTHQKHQRPFSSSSLSKAQCSRQHSINDPSKDECSFAPHIRQIPYPLYPSQWENSLKSKKEHWQQLTKDNRQRNLLRAQQKVQQEQGKFKEFTFSAPQSKRTEQQSSSQIFDRLFGQAERRKNQQILREQLALQEEQRKLSAQKSNRCQSSFQLNSEKFDLNPLYLRLEKVVQQQMEHKKALAETEQPSCSFKPSIDSKSAQMAKKDRINNIVDRLLTQHKNRQVKVNQLRQKLSQQLQSTLTFKPSINDYMPAQPPSKSRIVSQQQNNTYHPQINLMSAIMTRDRQYESEQQQLYRLHSAPGHKKQERKAQIAEQMYAECSFNPEINQLSKEMTHSSGKQHCCPTPVKATHSHKPKINEVSRTMSHSKRAQSLDNIKRKKKEKALVYLNETQYDELKQCTFRPKTLSRQDSKLSSTMASIDQVAGFSKFKSNLEKALQKQRAKRQLEEKLFHLQKSYDQRMLKKSKGGSKLQNVLC